MNKIRCVALACLPLTFTACTSSTPAPSRTVTVTSTVTASSSISEDTDTSTNEVTPLQDSSTADPSETDLTTPTSTQLGPQDAGRALGLSDFFNVSTAWTESRYGVADRKDIQGIAANVNCGLNSGQSLELRLTNSFKTLKFMAGQGNDSSTSTQILDVEVYGNNSQKDIRRIPFNTVQPFTINVSGVNAVIINFYLDSQSGDCNGQARAVFFGGTLS